MKIRIIKVTDGSFKGSEGESIPYFYFQAVRLSDEVNFEFGSTVEHSEGEFDLNLVKYEKKNGRIAWKEVVKK